MQDGIENKWATTDERRCCEMTRPRPVLTTYELEQVANIVHRLSSATQKEIDYTENYLKDCWPGSDPNWIVSFFAKLVQQAPSLNR
jgi:hypothetical protein